MHFITLNNLQNLARIFKQMEFYTEEDWLKSLGQAIAVRNTIQQELNFEKEKSLFLNDSKSVPKSKMELDNTNETSLTSEQQSLSSIPTKSLGGYYEINPNKPGIVLIISNEHFFTEIQQQYKVII